MDVPAEDVIEYFAIGSMMNKTSLTMRDLKPTKSRPACLKDFELIFGMNYGMAAARRSPGQKIHGVLHRITGEELVKLDKIETWYVREKVNVFTYEGEMSNDTQATQAYVYIFNPELVAKDPELFKEHPPQERYMDILKEGAKEYGVDKDYVSKTLETVQFLPRKPKSAMKTFKLPLKEGSDEAIVLPTWTMEDVKQKDAENPDLVILALNQHILQLDTSVWAGHRDILQTCRGTQLAYVIAGKWIYDPNFGVPASYEDMDQDHCASVEDWFIDFFGDMEEKWLLLAQLK
eukprot:GFUD01012893.1.p1 GENE.GFUD01012893.1~~GFUD01012893.1.p1  ORF type:complete len:290 (+),score=81.73 GFUD01012893.1:147-1016(+)